MENRSSDNLKRLNVFLKSELAGNLIETARSEMVFQYSHTASRPISVGMPLSKKTFENDHCQAFFGGLLPEGDQARQSLAKRFGISAKNNFSLLRAIGAECAGALTIVESATNSTSFLDNKEEEVKLLTDQELASYIRELPQRPLFVGIEGLRLSLAGVQDKASINVTRDGIGIPTKGPTTHILKPDLQTHPGVIFIEYLCMKTALRSGLNTANVHLRTAEDIVYLLVERYDRSKASKAAPIERIHQEDFCQALAIPSWQKYQDDGGPKLLNCFELLTKTALPARERSKLMAAVIFNFLISNYDAHGKNYSLLHAQTGIELAPLYDLICTGAFPESSQKFAMEIGDEFLTEDVNAFQWRTLCEDVGYSFSSFKTKAKTILAVVPAAIDIEYDSMAKAGFSHPACEKAIEIVKHNCITMKTKLSV